MRYGFIRLKNDDGTIVYMDIWQYERYSKYDIFKNHAESLVVFDNIYVACFPLMFKEAEIYEYNNEAAIDCVLTLKDISSKYSTPADVAKMLGCEN